MVIKIFFDFHSVFFFNYVRYFQHAKIRAFKTLQRSRLSKYFSKKEIWSNRRKSPVSSNA